jgi:hypothetical protein
MPPSVVPEKLHQLQQLQTALRYCYCSMPNQQHGQQQTEEAEDSEAQKT